jgi:hypothetical protein
MPFGLVDEPSANRKLARNGVLGSLGGIASRLVAARTHGGLTPLPMADLFAMAVNGTPAERAAESARGL